MYENAFRCGDISPEDRVSVVHPVYVDELVNVQRKMRIVHLG